MDTPRTPTLAIDQRLQLLVAGIRDYAIYMLDPEGRVASWNAGAERFKGYTAPEIIGEHFSRFFTPEDKAAGLPARALATALAEGKFESEGWRVRKDGSRFWATVVVDPIHDEHGQLVGFAKITRDVTERRQAQQKLRESEQVFSMLVNGISDYAIYMLSPTGEVTNWNLGAERIKGYRAEEVVGSHFSRFYTPEDQAAGMPARSLAIAAAEGRFDTEGWRVRKDGTRFWANVVVDAIHDDEGRLVGFAKITRDVTEKREASEALQRANAALFQSQKLQAIGQLTGGVAHDFNNLLSVLSSGLDVLSMSQGRAEPSLLDAMRRAVQRGSNLTQQLLAFARKQPLKPEHSNVNLLVNGFESVLRRAVPQSIAFEIELDPAMEMVSLDPQRFEAAILNLVVNARDAMPEGGTLLLKTAVVELRDKQVGSLPAGRYAQVLVVDSGEGMSAEVLERAVEPFFTTKEVGRGTGLGLSQVQGFISQSGGDLAIDSTPGQGTRIGIYLPVVEASASEARRNVAPIERVLVVDSGEGMSAEVLERAVEPFFTTKEVGRGTGLGLSQVQGFISQSGGDLAIDSTPGQGTRIGIYLPVVEASASEARRSVAPIERVLVVEDQPELLSLASSLFRSIGYDVLTASNGDDARRIIERDPAAVDILFTDVVMPGTSGVQLAQWVREAHPHVKVVLTSGYPKLELAGEHERVADYVFVDKPYRLPDLARALRSV